MGRLALDPKPIFGSPAFFGKEDLKVYGEIGVIGVQDYGFWYDDISKRMPIWSVYLKKTVFPGVAFTLQLARSHFLGNYNDGYPNFEESTVVPGDWAWTAKFAGNL